MTTKKDVAFGRLASSGSVIWQILISKPLWETDILASQAQGNETSTCTCLNTATIYLRVKQFQKSYFSRTATVKIWQTITNLCCNCLTHYHGFLSLHSVNFGCFPRFESDFITVLSPSLSPTAWYPGSLTTGGSTLSRQNPFPSPCHPISSPPHSLYTMRLMTNPRATFSEN